MIRQGDKSCKFYSVRPGMFVCRNQEHIAAGDYCFVANLIKASEAELKFYFVTYLYRPYPEDTPFAVSECLMEHPVPWLVAQNAAPPDVHGRINEVTAILFWSEITRDQYDAWDEVQ